MKNIIVEKNEDKLSFIVDLDEKGSPSKTGKMMLVANSQGWTELDIKNKDGTSYRLMMMVGYSNQ